MPKKKYLFVAVLLFGSFIAGGYLAQSKVLEKNWYQLDQAAKKFVIDQCVNYLRQNPNGQFNETARKIYKDLTGHEYYEESIYDWAWRMQNTKTIPNTGIPCTIKCP